MSPAEIRLAWVVVCWLGGDCPCSMLLMLSQHRFFRTIRQCGSGLQKARALFMAIVCMVLGLCSCSCSCVHERFAECAYRKKQSMARGCAWQCAWLCIAHVGVPGWLCKRLQGLCAWGLRRLHSAANSSLCCQSLARAAAAGAVCLAVDAAYKASQCAQPSALLAQGAQALTE